MEIQFMPSDVTVELPGCQTSSDDEIDDDSYDRFTDELQKCVSENDAVIIMESGTRESQVCNRICFHHH